MVQLDGIALNDSGQFRFRIESTGDSGFQLSIQFCEEDRYSTAAGVWPSIEKAKSVAEITARKLLCGATVNWQ